ncbi:MAG: hypothetical protein Q9157_003849 [Trypethelium eluteriae]
MALEESPSNDFRKLRVETNSPIRPPPSPFAALSHDDSVAEGSQETLRPVGEVQETSLDTGPGGHPELPLSYGSSHSDAVTSNSESPDGSTRARGSICFNDKIRLDDGRVHSLHEPLSKKKGRSRSRGRSILQELAQDLNNSEGAVESPGYAGDLKEDPFDARVMPSGRDTRRQQANGNHFLESTDDKHPRQNEEELKDYDKVASLTSDSSVSPSVDEVNTPIDAIPQLDSLPSPVATGSPASYTANSNTTGPIPMPFLRRTSSAFSKGALPDGSRPANLRRNSRRHSRRSTSNSTSKSPASAFLSQYAAGGEEYAALAEPDHEGQEIGDHSKYIIGREIGRGGFSSVKEVFTMEGSTRIRRAVKIVRKRVPGASEAENEKMQAKFEHEVSVWRYLRHRHILALLAVYDTPFATFCITRLNQGGTLFDLVRRSRKASTGAAATTTTTTTATTRGTGTTPTPARKPGLPAPLATRYLAQLASALRYLHEDVRMVHRDVKLENCLIDMSGAEAHPRGFGTLQLCDFGMADFITEDSCVSDIAGAVQEDEHSSGGSSSSGGGGGGSGGKNAQSADPSVVLGSLEYASPEGLASRGIPMFVTTGDVWAFGVIAFTVLVGELPFRHELAPKLQSKILGGEWDVQALRRAPAVAEMEDGEGKVEEMVRGCLTVDTAERWRITDVVGSRWLTEYQDSEEETDRSWD